MPKAVLLLLWSLTATGLGASPGEPAVKRPNLVGNIERPLRYWPEGTDFVIENGAGEFNRPLYGGNTAFRVDAGDRPVFGLYLPGRGGVLRLAVRTGASSKWLDQADRITARYRPGAMLYRIEDKVLGDCLVQVAAIALYAAEGVVLRVEAAAPTEQVELVWTYGGVNGDRGRRNVDIGAEAQPVDVWWQMRSQHCTGNRFTVYGNRFRLDSRQGQIYGLTSQAERMAIADAGLWPSIEDLVCADGDYHGSQPILVCRFELRQGIPVFILVQRTEPTGQDLGQVFDIAQRQRAAIAGRLAVHTPDPFLDAAVAALNIAADAIWDEPSGTVMHGAVAWRSRLLGWRGPYANDALGWHDRARRHILYWASRQNTSAVPEKMPGPDESANLSRCEAALHSNGDISNSHYDMNLVYIDMLLRHLLWTGDLDLAGRLWPVIERHLAWERRLFRRPFGPEGLPLYEAYACFWASDDIAYNGGGTTVASAYNYWHNLMAARLAGLLDKDSSPYQKEARLIRQAMDRYLWLEDKGLYAEYRDLLGLQLAHDSPGLWSFYHAVDSQACSGFQAWQASRFVDLQIPHIPVRGSGLPEGDWFTLATTNWMPYCWSTNNVVMAESAHTALAYWQIGRPDQAWRLFKGAILDSMYMGLCPGNLGMCTGYDVYRREAQRDFADAVGTVSRAVVEGLFGIRPDGLSGTILINPGLPSDWTRAVIRHPSVNYQYRRDGLTDTYLIEPNMPFGPTVRLQVPARFDRVDAVTVNGSKASWQSIEDPIGRPVIDIQAGHIKTCKIQIRWAGDPVRHDIRPVVCQVGQRVVVRSPDPILAVRDPQHLLDQGVRVADRTLEGTVKAQGGDYCLFVHVRQGQMDWWEPLYVEVKDHQDYRPFTIPQDPNWQVMDISRLFNANITQIFQNQYLSPRSPYCSLSTPRQGTGTWCRPHATAQIDDSGLRSVTGGVYRLPQGLPFATPGPGDGPNVAFLSRWDNYPNELTIGLSGRARHLYILMAGTTGPMHSRFDNAEVVVAYADGSSERLALRNPINWWPIDQDYFIDDFQFRRPQPIPPRLYLRTGQVYMYDPVQFKGKGGPVSGGAASILDMALDPGKVLGSMTVRVLANEVIVGVMAVTVAR